MVLLRRMLWLVQGLQRYSWMHIVLRAVSVALLLLPAMVKADSDDLALCYREDAAPFSYVDDAGKPAGFSVDLCLRASEHMGQSNPQLIAVSVENRFEELGKTCDVLCEATTMTLDRRKDMEFSLIIFVTGTALLYPRELPEKNNQNDEVLTVGLLSDTTTHNKWKSGNLISGSTWNFEFKSVSSHDVAVQELESGVLDAYIADREILEAILEGSQNLQDKLQIGLRSLSYEPYALAVPMGADDIRIRIDETLVELFRSGEIDDILVEHVPNRRFDPILAELFRMQSLPD